MNFRILYDFPASAKLALALFIVVLISCLVGAL